MKSRVFFILLISVGLIAALPATVDKPATSPALLSDLSTGPKPSISIRTNEVVYLPGDSITLTADMNNNGHRFPKSFFLYLETPSSATRRYINTTDGLLDPGEVTDIVGNPADSPAVFPIPNVSDLAFLGPGGLFGDSLSATAGLVENHRFVLELRDASGRYLFFRTSFQFTIVDSVIPVTQNITADTTWTSNNAYLLDDIAIFVENGATLTIEAGTYVLGLNLGTLVVARGGRMVAAGTAARPIVMTSALSVGERGPANWGGLIFNGRAPVNPPGGVGIGEGGTGEFGGSMPGDSSGTICYVRVEFAGFEFSPDNELNGIAFQGVGSGTEVHHVQVHFNLDDGVEMFGGTVNLKYILLTGEADDSLDYTDGWIGLAQFIVAQQRGRDADQGFEFDNSGENNDLLPRSFPIIYNFTLVGDPSFDDGPESDIGMLVREGTRLAAYNGIVTGFKEDGVDIDDVATFAQQASGELVIDNSIFWNNGQSLNPANCGAGAVVGNNIFGCNDAANAGGPFTTANFLTTIMQANRFSDPGLRDPFNVVSPDFRPAIDSIARDQNFVRIPPDSVTLADGRVIEGFFDTTVTYVGGVDPLNDWTQQGWAYFGDF